jgi:type IV secretion system protein TrbL
MSEAMIEALGDTGGKILLLDFQKVESCILRVKGFKDGAVRVNGIVQTTADNASGCSFSGFNNPPTISDALTLILAALSLLGLTIFGPGIANGLVAGGPQLGAGAAVGTGLAAAGIGAASVAATAGGIAAARGAIAGTARTGAAVAGGATAAYRAGGTAGLAQATGSVAMSPLRRTASSLKESFVSGERAVMRGNTASNVAAGISTGASTSPPAWAQRMKREQTIERGVTIAGHAIRSGDQSGSGHQPNLRQGE